MLDFVITDAPTTSTVSTEFGIDDKRINYLFAMFLLVVFCSSLIGDSIILAASILPHGIRLNKFIVTVMQHIAVSDLISCFSFVLPTAVSMISNRWVVKGVLSYIRLFTDMAVFGANAMLICSLSVSKLFLLKHPTQTPIWTVDRAHIVCAIIWLFASIFPILYFVFDGMESFKWMYKNSSPLDYLAYFRIGCTQVLPTLIMIVTTVLILCHLVEARRIARRGGGRRRLRGVATVVITVSVYCVSLLPTTWTYIYSYVDRKADLILLSWISTCFTGLNIMSHIYVYSLTIPSLREFIRTKILRRPSFKSLFDATRR